MTRSCSIFLTLISILLISTSVNAQAPDAAWQTAYPGYPGYPGSFLVAPQDSSFTAPAIYRSLNTVNNLGNPVQVDQICSKDIKAMFQKHVFNQLHSVAPGVENAVSLSVKVGASASLAKVIKVEASAQYEQVVKLTTGDVRVLSSDDDTVAADVLQNIQAKCRGVIRSHLRQNRLVFIAAKAIQAHNYSAEKQRVPLIRLSGECTGWFSWCSWFGAKGEITGRYSSDSRSLAPNQYVTIALVPAQLENRISVMSADLEAPAVPTAAPASEFRRMARGASPQLRRVAAQRVSSAWSWAATMGQPDWRDKPWYGEDATGNELAKKRIKNARHYALALPLR